MHNLNFLFKFVILSLCSVPSMIKQAYLGPSPSLEFSYNQDSYLCFRGNRFTFDIISQNIFPKIGNCKMLRLDVYCSRTVISQYGTKV